MKKLKYIIPIAIVAVFISLAIYQRASQDKSNRITKSTRIEKANSSRKTSQKNSNSKQDSSATSNITESTSSNQAVQKESSFNSSKSQANTSSGEANRLVQLNQGLKSALGNVLLPQVIEYDKSQKLNIRYTGDNNNYSIYYLVGSKELPLNDNQLVGQSPVAIIQKKTYRSVSLARDQINYQPQESGLPEVDLGSGIKGNRQGTTGSQYITWQEGRWSLTVQSVASVNGSDQAKKMVAYFNDASLPIPDVHGAVQTYVGSNNVHQNTVVWSQGNSLYSISANNFMSALTMGTSLR